MCGDLELWVTPCTYVGEDFPEGPTPETAGLRENILYRVLDVAHDTQRDSETYIVVVNEEGELWSISNRHVRVEDATNHEGSSRRVFRNIHEEQGWLSYDS